MVQVTEFQVVMPLSVEEYRKAQMYMVTRMQEQQTSGSEGVEVLVNEPFENEEFGKGQYTSKIYRLQSKAPSWLTAIAPTNALLIEEEAWNAYPKCKTVLKCPYFSRFKLTVETLHVEDNGRSENVHNLPSETLRNRKVEMVDIASNVRDYWYYVIGGEDVDLSTFMSQKTGRGLLTTGWQETCEPVMTAYKLVTVDAPYWGFGYRLEQLVLAGERALFVESHKRCVAWIDEWFGLSFNDIRRLELQMDEKLKRTMLEGKATGLVEGTGNGVATSADIGQGSVLGTSSVDSREGKVTLQTSYSPGKLEADKRVDGSLSNSVAVMI